MDSFSGDQWRGRWKSSVTISCDYSVTWFATTSDWRCQRGLREKGWTNSSSFRPFFSSDCAVDAGYQVAEIGSCVFLYLAWLVCGNWRLYWELVRSFVWLFLHDLYDIYNIHIVWVFIFKLSHEILCSYVWLFMVLMCVGNWFYFRN